MTLSRRLFVAGMGISASASFPVFAKPAARKQVADALDADAFNGAADTPLLKMGQRSPAVARAQILMDRAWFSCGEIDGHFGKNMQRMVKAYQGVQGLKATGTVDAATWKALREQSPEPLLTRYTITDKDAAGPFEATPKDMAERAKLKALPYASLAEALGERFHANPDWLARINRGKKLEGGAEIWVPDVREAKAPTRASALIEIDKSEKVLFVLDADNKAVAGFPISIGNEKNDPLPIGEMAIKNVAENPTFTYNPAILKNAPKDAQKVEVPAGPNNPVGTLWLGLTKPHWGIHGTPEPSQVGHSETNGCIHLTNWDVERLAKIVKVGAKVNVRP